MLYPQKGSIATDHVDLPHSTDRRRGHSRAHRCADIRSVFRIARLKDERHSIALAPPEIIALIGTPPPSSTCGRAQDRCAWEWRSGCRDAPLFPLKRRPSVSSPVDRMRGCWRRPRLPTTRRRHRPVLHRRKIVSRRIDFIVFGFDSSSFPAMTPK